MIMGEEYKEIINKYKEENKELIESGKCKHVFLECLPKKIYGNKHVIDWNNSVGHFIYIIYNEYECTVEIIEIKDDCVILKYNNNEYRFNKYNFMKSRVSKLFNIKTKNFRLSIGEDIVDEKRDFVIIDREYRLRIKKDNSKENQKWYKYYCNKCGNEDWIEESKLLTSKRGCNRCSGHRKVDRTNCISTTRPNLIKYFKNKEDVYKYSYSSGKYTIFKCPHCGFEKSIKIEHFVSFGFSCPKCSDGISYPNKFMFNLLSQLNINFETEYSPEWIRPKRYDFYFKLNGEEYIIEMDGGFHYIGNNMSGKSYKELKEIDDYKDKLAEKHRINVIRIDCNYKDMLCRFNYVKNSILNSKLNDIFDLDNINWLHIDFKSQKSKLLEVCNYWNEVSKDKKKISKLFNISSSTVNDYLHKGEELGLCKYERNKVIYTKSKMKSIKCITTGEYFECVNDIDLNKYNIDKKSKINKVCNSNNRNRYTGTLNGQKLEWCYITKEEYNNYIDGLNK